MGNTVKFLYDEDLNNAATSIRVINKQGSQKETILKAFYQNDFHMSITNQWNTGDSGMISSLINSVGSMINSRDGRLMTELLDKGLKKMGDPGDEEGRRLKENFASGLSKVRDIQHAHIFSAEQFFKTFKGSTVVFPLNLQVSLLSDEWEPKEDIFDKLAKIINVSVGDYEAPEVLGGFVGIQHAPNGFRSSTFNLSKTERLEGSLQVIYGDPELGGFTLDNMLISNVQTTFSKTQVRVRKDVYRPLYIDVQLMLEPGKKFTKSDIATNLGFPKGSLKSSKNFVYKSGKSPKEEKEDSLARKRHIQSQKEITRARDINFQITQDYSSIDMTGVENTVEGDVIKLNGKITRDQYEDIFSTMSVTPLSNYPGITRIDLSNLEIEN